MSKNKIIGIILIIIGILLLLVGKFFVLKNNKKTKNNNIKVIKLEKEQCLNNVCIENLRISSNKNTRITGDIVNNNSTKVPAGIITIEFTLDNNKTKILEYDFLDLEPDTMSSLDYITTIDGYDKAKSYKVLSIN